MDPKATIESILDAFHSDDSAAYRDHFGALVRWARNSGFLPMFNWPLSHKLIYFENGTIFELEGLGDGLIRLTWGCGTKEFLVCS